MIHQCQTNEVSLMDSFVYSQVNSKSSNVLDGRVDDYISKSPDFAKPILIHLRTLVHTACPLVEETTKWGFPHFEYKGMLCSMAAFKNHCAFGFWKASLMKDAATLKENNEAAMGHSGKIQNLKDLPTDKIIIDRIKEAMQLNDDGVKLPDKKNTDKKAPIIIPDSLKREFVKNKKVTAIFNNLSPSHRREYIEWIEEAKTEQTTRKRVLITIEWLAEGKTRNWKHQKK